MSPGSGRGWAGRANLAPVKNRWYGQSISSVTAGFHSLFFLSDTSPLNGKQCLPYSRCSGFIHSMRKQMGSASMEGAVADAARIKNKEKKTKGGKCVPTWFYGPQLKTKQNRTTACIIWQTKNPRYSTISFNKASRDWVRRRENHFRNCP